MRDDHSLAAPEHSAQTHHHGGDMTPTSTFDLPAAAADKAAPHRIAADDHHLLRIAAAIEADIAAVQDRLEQALREHTGDAQGRVEREASVDHFRRRLSGLQSFRLDAVLGRMTPADGSAPRYIGRLAVHDQDGTALLVDWRSPVAEPFFAATRAEPMGLASRRRYRWAGGRIRDYWDESLAAVPAREDESLDADSALLATLGRARSPKMDSVLTTLAADQDAIIRADSRLPLVVDGGPGTGKTVVALHRAAYLLYSDPRLRPGRGGVLFIGPHHPFLRYVSDVLPSLGEDGVLTATLTDLVPEGSGAAAEEAPEVAALKGSRELVAAIDPAVAVYEEPPTETSLVETPWGSVQLDAEDWADAYAAADPAGGAPHNLAREEIWEELAEIISAQLGERYDEHPSAEQVRESLAQDEELVALVHRAWPLLSPTDLVGDLFEVPAYLRRCAPTLTEHQVQLLQRSPARAWTVSDLPLLDTARHRLGDPEAEARGRRQQAARKETVEEIGLMVEYLIASDSSEMREMSMLRGADLRNALEDATHVEVAPPDALAGPFGHIIVDEAQELNDAQWAMILRRCPSRSLTVVGDRAQASTGFTQSWRERLARVGLDRVEMSSLTLNYRTPTEVMAEAAPVIRAEIPDANVPESLRSTGRPVRCGAVDELDELLEQWFLQHDEGTAAVIGAEPRADWPRVSWLSPWEAKGLEFDLVVLVRPEMFGDGVEGAVTRYVAMTRATQELVILEQ